MLLTLYYRIKRLLLKRAEKSHFPPRAIESSVNLAARVGNEARSSFQLGVHT